MKQRPNAPMDLGDIISSAWLLCVRHWRPLLAMSLLTCAAILVCDVGILAILERAQPNLRPTPAMPRVSFGFAPLLALGGALYFYNQLALIRYSLDCWVGPGGNVARSYVLAARSFLPALVAVIITAIVFVFAVVAATITAKVFIVGLVTWFSLPLAVYFAVSWIFAGQVCLAEQETRPFRAMRRSRAIVKGRWWRTAGILLGITLLSLLPSLAAGQVRLGPWAPALFISAMATAIAAPFTAAAQTMLYLDLRLRNHESITLTPGEPPQPL